MSLEQVDELYAKVDKAWNSPGFVPTVNFTDVQDVGKGEGRRHTLAELENEAGRRKSSAGGVHTEIYAEKGRSTHV